MLPVNPAGFLAAGSVNLRQLPVWFPYRDDFSTAAGFAANRRRPMEIKNVRVECWVRSLQTSGREKFAGRFHVAESDGEAIAIRFLRETPNASRVTIGTDVVYAISGYGQSFQNGNGTRTIVQAGQIARIEGENEAYLVTAIA